MGFADIAARSGLAALAVSVSAATFLIFDVVVGRGAALAATALALVVFVVNWLLLPLLIRHRLTQALSDATRDGGPDIWGS